jgi:hypothetical protein
MLTHPMAPGCRPSYPGAERSIRPGSGLRFHHFVGDERDGFWMIELNASCFALPGKLGQSENGEGILLFESQLHGLKLQSLGTQI